MEDTTKEKKLETNFRDLQHELAGLDVGRLQRFLPETTNTVRISQEKKGKLSAWDIYLLTQLRYTALFQEVEDTLQQEETSVRKALTIIDQRLEQARERLDHLLAKAHTLPDGTKVFRSENTNMAFTIDGRQLSEEEKNSIEWDGTRPSLEDYREAKEAVEKSEQDKEQIVAYEKHILNPARERIRDPENKPSEEELKEILESLKKNRPAIVEELNRQTSIEADVGSNYSAAQLTTGDAGLGTPNLDGQFRSAGLGLPDLGEIQPADNSGIEFKR